MTIRRSHTDDYTPEECPEELLVIEARAGEVWQEADGVLLLCVEPGKWWQDFRGDRVPWDAPTIARPLRLLLDRDGNLAAGFVRPEDVAEAREQMRQKMLAAPMTDERNTYQDGYGQGLAEAIGLLDRAVPAAALRPVEES